MVAAVAAPGAPKPKRDHVQFFVPLALWNDLAQALIDYRERKDNHRRQAVVKASRAFMRETNRVEVIPVKDVTPLEHSQGVGCPE